MKQLINFKLSSHTINTLTILEKESSDKNSLLEYAGILNEDEAFSMLSVIQSSKHNKNIKAAL